MRVVITSAVLVLALVSVAVFAQQPAKKASPVQGKVEPAAPSKAALAISMPPIPSPGFAPGRPVAQARAVYEFAARHPEILKFVPCYCGCESSGHPHNESCFVKRRDPKGNVLEWDTHGYG
jgi:hypothetical protein